MTLSRLKSSLKMMMELLGSDLVLFFGELGLTNYTSSWYKTWAKENRCEASSKKDDDPKQKPVRSRTEELHQSKTEKHWMWKKQAIHKVRRR